MFRAFSLEAYLTSKGATRIIPIADKEIAYKLKKENPDFLLVGERQGKILPEFDYGNSPSQIEEIDLTGKTIIHTTSAGTQGFINAQGADELLTGALVNAEAIAKYIKQKTPEKVSLVCMGLEATKPSEEDTFCAEYIKSLILGEKYDIKGKIGIIKKTSGARFFDKNLQKDSPKKDFRLCIKTNIFNFVLRLVKGVEYNYIEKLIVD